MISAIFVSILYWSITILVLIVGISITYLGLKYFIEEGDIIFLLPVIIGCFILLGFAIIFFKSIAL